MTMRKILLAATAAVMLAMSASAMAADEAVTTERGELILDMRQMDTVAAGFYPGYGGIWTYNSDAARSFYQQVRVDLDALSAALRGLY